METQQTDTTRLERLVAELLQEQRRTNLLLGTLLDNAGSQKAALSRIAENTRRKEETE